MELYKMLNNHKTEFLSYKQAMELLGFKNYTALNYYINAGLPVYVVGKSKRIKKSDILEFMEAHKQVKK